MRTAAAADDVMHACKCHLNPQILNQTTCRQLHATPLPFDTAHCFARPAVSCSCRRAHVGQGGGTRALSRRQMWMFHWASTQLEERGRAARSKITRSKITRVEEREQSMTSAPFKQLSPFSRLTMGCNEAGSLGPLEFLLNALQSSAVTQHMQTRACDWSPTCQQSL